MKKQISNLSLILILYILWICWGFNTTGASTFDVRIPAPFGAILNHLSFYLFLGCSTFLAYGKRPKWILVIFLVLVSWLIASNSLLLFCVFCLGETKFSYIFADFVAPLTGPILPLIVLLLFLKKYKAEPSAAGDGVPPPPVP